VNQNKRLLVLLGITLGICGLLAAFWFLGVGPYLDKLKAVNALESEVREKKLTLLDMQGETAKLRMMQVQSLPADADLAKREYDLVLMKLLRESGNTGFTVNPDPNASRDKKGIPLIDSSKKASYAYQKVVFNIRIPKTDLASVTEFLRRYYSMPLHQQITRIELKKLSVELSADKRPLRERNDIDATIVTEAIIVDGAPTRKSALPVPLAQGAALGGGAWAMIEQQPKAALGIAPMPISQMLSTGNRDYYLLSAKDLFHGTLPAIPPIIKESGPKQEIVVVPPKPNHSFAIKYGTLFRNNDGYEQTTEARIYDLINNEDYELVITQTGEKTKCSVRKYYYIGDKRKPPERSTTLEISNVYMSNKNNFTVLAVDGDDLILSETASGLAPPTVAPKEDKPKTTSGSKRTPLPPPDPRAMVLGGFAVTAPKPEKFYRWEYGKTLADLVELTKAEADKAVQRAHSRVISELEVTNAKPGK
jgi:hypothetical protein